ncbi:MULTISPECIES: porin OmpAII [Aeromonas]|uniref:Porin OmpAII n=3 Tax=Bacteria TaxID=2 RepID=A0A3L0W4Q0_ECOLX|nr:MULTISPECIES: porin OmpAII [Aeromonas]MBP6383837.1 porin OmpAII [Aeromonas sp.]ATP10524.1 outer membrane protein OmpA [Aeromonas salmonicida subsp. pectinolytica 34mel]EQC05306.1 outer membrane protein [Aeromonas salmonicida subsp. pectinolytica 34mel]KTA84659.1 membrane protein [Aeromonas salmonicida]MBP6450733.1 porin OmpAII [Aeromonas sp.]
MKMKMAPALIALAIAAMGTSTAQAADDWYTGIGAGWAYGHDLNDFGKDADKDATALSLFGGYNFNDYYAAELGYLYTGKAGVDGVDFKTQGATLSGLARLPLGDIFSVFAEGGAYFNHVNGNGNSDNGTAPLAGVGLTAKLSDLIDVQARYRYMWNLGDEQKTWETDMSVATLELVMHPNRTSYVAPVAAPAPEPVPEPVVVDKSFSLSSDVLFAFGKSTLKPEGVASLNTLYQQIVDVQPKDGSAVVVGYTDRIGSDGYNLKLSEARARTVADFLVGKGLPAGKVSIDGRGKAEPVTGTQCDGIKAKAQLIACLAPDRRVEVRVTGIQEVTQ